MYSWEALAFSYWRFIYWQGVKLRIVERNENKAYDTADFELYKCVNTVYCTWLT